MLWSLTGMQRTLTRTSRERGTMYGDVLACSEVVEGQDYAIPDSLTEEFAIRSAKEKDCVIEFSHDRVLQLDIDSDGAYDKFFTQLQMLFRYGVVDSDSYQVRYSRSGNRHVTIDLRNPLPVRERIFLQALLGSDITREALAMIRLKTEAMENPVLLFRPKNDPQCNGS